ncbi:ClpS-like protein [Tilletiaria anomala UBC 951]|uniref:ClpS-like protein n=1 Tax=Tilletiaria anomala (strain ATCC 24038 / CBS 436.72 / UBC 951) TaxID=1037660 RepID=A0A066WQ10_TILAU|nr:ClpS-like protein [Tilletiaria anomala UBC 951]KDN53094.1 ClpS-like protein [Tilletiaria anomala UBC 951]
MFSVSTRAIQRITGSGRAVTCPQCLLKEAGSSRAVARSLVRSLATAANSDAVPSAASSSAAPSGDLKLLSIVDQIEKLTLLEASDLVGHLKTRLNITDIAMPSAAPAATASPAADAAPVEAEKPKEKTVFTVKLTGLKDASAKAKVIKEIKALNSNMNLVEAKKFVENAPQTLKEGLNKEDAEKLQKAIEAAGGTAELE